MPRFATNEAFARLSPDNRPAIRYCGLEVRKLATLVRRTCRLYIILRSVLWYSSRQITRERDEAHATKLMWQPARQPSFSLSHSASRRGTSRYAPLSSAFCIRVLYHSFNDTQLQVAVRGILGDIPATEYRVCYRVPLRDGTQAVYLDIPRQLLTSHNIGTGDYVQVTGVLSVDDGQSQSSRVDIRVAVSDVQRVDRPGESKREERATLECLRQFRPTRAAFPDIRSIRISVIHPMSARARVQDDFQRAVAPAVHLCELELIPVAMNRTDAIAAGIRQMTGNVLALIRGGASDDSELDVFDQKAVIEAWAAKTSTSPRNAMPHFVQFDQITVMNQADVGSRTLAFFLTSFVVRRERFALGNLKTLAVQHRYFVGTADLFQEAHFR